MLNGFSSESSLAISRRALRGPSAAGAKVTLKVVLSPGRSTTVPGGTTVNSAAFAPGYASLGVALLADLVQRIETARTPADHEALASYYDREASAARARRSQGYAKADSASPAVEPDGEARSWARSLPDLIAHAAAAPDDPPIISEFILSRVLTLLHGQPRDWKYINC